MEFTALEFIFVRRFHLRVLIRDYLPFFFSPIFFFFFFQPRIATTDDCPALRDTFARYPFGSCSPFRDTRSLRTMRFGVARNRRSPVSRITSREAMIKFAVAVACFSITQRMPATCAADSEDTPVSTLRTRAVCAVWWVQFRACCAMGPRPADSVRMGRRSQETGPYSAGQPARRFSECEVVALKVRV